MISGKPRAKKNGYPRRKIRRTGCHIDGGFLKYPHSHVCKDMNQERGNAIMEREKEVTKRARPGGQI